MGSTTENNNKRFKYVFIPCNDQRSIEELELEIFNEAEELECFLNALKEHFVRTERECTEDRTITEEKKQEKLKEQLEKQSNGNKIDEEMLKVASKMQMVQPVALLPGGTKNGFIHVNMYVDDKGISKGLKINKRASDFTNLLHVPNHVYGDAFIARIFDDERSDFKRIDFTLQELQSDAEWVIEAKRLNLERRQNLGNAKETIAKMGGNLNTENGIASFNDEGDDDDEFLRNMSKQKQTEEELNLEAVVEGTSNSYPYTWMQDEDEVVLIANVPGDTDKSKISLTFSGQSKMNLSCFAVEPSVIVDCSGNENDLFQEIIPSDSSWSLVKQKDGSKNLEVTLVKAKSDLRWLCFTRMRSGNEEKKKK